MKKIAIVLVLLCLVLPLAAQRATTYTYTPNPKGSGFFTRTGDAYLPGATITELGLVQPQDLFIDSDNLLYIADTGNRRIILFDPETETVINEIVHPDMIGPAGLWVTRDRLIYAADPRARTVFVFRIDGSYVRRYERPTQLSFGNRQFAPRKISVDTAGNMYIIGEGLYDGVIQLSPDGNFLGYFTSNKIQLSIIERLQDLFFTDAQKANLLDRVPVTFSNLFLDRQNILYTSSIGDHPRAIKKHNAAGFSIMTAGIRPQSAPVDLWVDPSGIIVVVFDQGQTIIYSNEGDVIASFGYTRQSDDIIGLFTRPTAVAIDSVGRLWYLDGEKGFLQSYEPTPYITNTYRALELFDEGRYRESIEVWQEVLKVNQVSQIAHLSIGKNYLFLRDYNRAMYHTRIANNREFYSASFWEIRNVWLQRNIMYIVLLIVLSMTIGPVFRLLRKKIPALDTIFDPFRRFAAVPFVNDVLYQFTIMKKPSDGFYYLRHRQKGSTAAAVFLLLTFFIVFLLNLTSKGFIFQQVFIEDIDFTSIVIGFFGGIFLFILCNYLGTSVNDGRGGMSDLFRMFAYSLAPLGLALLLSTVLTHILTLNEVFAIQLIMIIGWTWSIVLLLVGVKEVHDYGLQGTLFSIAFSLMFMLVLIIVMVILTVMGQQLYQFIMALVKEFLRNVS
ncbi:hypothetical protein JCM12856_31310 [Spirochaeta dissipatitropha]